MDIVYTSDIRSRVKVKEQVLEEQARRDEVVGDKFIAVLSNDYKQFHYQIIMRENDGYEAFGVPYATSSWNYCLHMRKKEKLHAE